MSAPVLSEVRATIDGVPRWEDAPIVGRAEELGRLLAHVDQAVAGRTSAVLLAGDAGVGKTRLLDELGARAAARGVRVLTGHCVDLGDVGLPYLPFVDLLRPVAGEPELAPVSSANPVLAGFMAGRPGDRPPVMPAGEGRDLSRPLPNRATPQPVDDGRLQLFESVAGLICEVAASGPLLIVLEDVHWADRSSRDLLRYLRARLVDEPVAVVASYRADDLHRRHPLRPLLAELVRLPGVERVELAPLPDAEVGALVRGLAASTGGLPESIVANPHDRAPRCPVQKDWRVRETGNRLPLARKGHKRRWSRLVLICLTAHEQSVGLRTPLWCTAPVRTDRSQVSALFDIYNVARARINYA